MPSNSFQHLNISTQQASNYALQYYNVQTTAKKLPGEVDFNFYLKTENGEAFTLKISRPHTTEAELDFQNQIIRHLAQKNLPYQIPEPIPTTDGLFYKKIEDEQGQHRWIRLQKWVEGRMIDDVHPRSPELLEQWGKTAGQLAAALQDFEHPYAHRFYKWNPSETLFSKKYLPYIQDETQQEIAQYFWNLFKKETLPKLPTLRKGINYNDAHEHNLLANFDLKNPKITGVIDFGDALFTETINELAIACAYACMGMVDPLEAATQVIKGFHQVFTLREKEIEVLYSLISARLMITAANAAWNKHNEPDNEYLLISEKPAWDLLKKWRAISPDLAYYTFRAACGWEACPKAKVFHDWIEEQKRNSSPTLFADVVELNEEVKALTELSSLNTSIPIDLSVGSLDLGNNSNFEDIKTFQRTINHYLEDNEATLCYGGYGEIRPFYTTDAYQIEGNNGAQWRTVHLGLDFWTKAETPVYAPLDGKIHSFANNEGDCNYGPTIILEHQVSEELTFYTLYGHLTLDSLNDLEVGQTVKKGQAIAKIGGAAVNGNWPPHLHFQIILDMLGEKGDFAGVAYPHQKEVWLSVCPNPEAIVPSLGAFFKNQKLSKKFEGSAKNPSEDLSRNIFGAGEISGCSSKTTTIQTDTVGATQKHSYTRGRTLLKRPTPDILKIRQQKLGKSLSISYQKPLHIVRGYRQYLYDTNAKRYLDTVNNVAHVGHEHPRVVRAAQRQIGLLNTNTRYLHNNIIQFAEELLATFPPELSVVHFVNSGSEANELALRMAKTWSGQKDMIAVEVGYHGNTNACIDISSYKFDGKGGKGAPPHTHVIPIPDTYRGLYRNPKTAGKLYAQHAQEAIEKIQKAGRNVAGFIAESILSCGGQVMLPEGYLKAIYEQVRAAGGLCIADEVQVGFGRVGEHFWGFELQSVIPDIVTMGKPIGNGHPLAAVVTTRKVAEAFANGMEYFNTFGGNPVSCAIGREVLPIVKDENLQQNAKEVGDYLKQELKKLQASYPIIGDVRGVGLFLGFELVKDRTTLEPAAEEATYLSNRMCERGILMSTDGPFHNVLKLKPPMCFDRGNVDFLVENLIKVLKEDFLNP